MESLHIVYVSSEIVPFVKTGGLADVAGALPEALAKSGNEVSVFVPLYSTIDIKKFNITPLKTDIPVTIENDATAAALGEHLYGAARNLRHFFYVFLGTGLGAGIIIDGLFEQAELSSV